MDTQVDTCFSFGLMQMPVVLVMHVGMRVATSLVSVLMNVFRRGIEVGTV